MNALWTPWRFGYISGSEDTVSKGVPSTLRHWSDVDPQLTLSADARCVFCNMLAAVRFATENGMAGVDADREALIVARGERIFVCLNRYPYSSGHVMVLPYLHCASLAELPGETAGEMMEWAQRVEKALRSVYMPDGLNFGMNLGEAAGAGVAGHLHLHAVPRWVGDTNFMTVMAETRILPETLETTWDKLREALR